MANGSRRYYIQNKKPFGLKASGFSIATILKSKRFRRGVFTMSSSEPDPLQSPASDFSQPILRSPKSPKIEPVALRTPRLFLREPGWQVALKIGSERLFCYLTEPGETHYHRIVDGEIHLIRDDEKVCLPCAERRGLLAFEPKRLREPSAALNFLINQVGDDELLQILNWEEPPVAQEGQD